MQQQSELVHVKAQAILTHMASSNGARWKAYLHLALYCLKRVQASYLNFGSQNVDTYKKQDSVKFREEW